MGKKVCQVRSPSEASIRASENITPEEKRVIWRALKWAPLEFKRLHSCMEDNLIHFYGKPDRECDPHASSSVCGTCDCTEIESYVTAVESIPELTQEEIDCMVKLCEESIYGQIKRLTGRDPRVPVCRAEFYLVPVLLSPSETESESSESKTAISFHHKVFREEGDPPCSKLREQQGICYDRVESVLFRHFDSVLSVPSAESQVSRFRLGPVGPSELIAKWGRITDIVEYVLSLRDANLTQCYDHTGYLAEKCRAHKGLFLPSKIELHKSHSKTKYTFRDLDRFNNIEYFGFSVLCRSLLRWSDNMTKRWDCIKKHSHVIIHLPSMNYPINLRPKCQNKFKCVQNIQIGRLGWLVNKKADVIYVYPSKSNFEIECYLRTLVNIARPDILQSRLTLLVDDEECPCKTTEEYRSGCERLFNTPEMYERLRNLSIGRQALIVPGVLSKTDVFIACELKTPVLGPCFLLQQHLLDKLYVMSLLAKENIPHPPFAEVRNFTDLCEKMVKMMYKFTEDCLCGRWLVKLNIGYHGNQTGLVTLDCNDLNQIQDQKQLMCYLKTNLPQKLRLSKKAYNNVNDFFEDLEKFGGIVQACPEGEFTAVSLGCFIEHDLAKACMRTSADVIRMATEEGCNCGDICYVIPQTSLPNDELEDLAVKIGDILSLEPFIGFFCIDLVVFSDKDEKGEEKKSYWVVDVDSHYSDLLSFEDWRRFCLDIPIYEKFCINPTLLDENDRFVVCSGKLYIDGLRHQTGNFLIELCEKNKIAYSHKSKTGVMICPVDPEKNYFVVFALCRGRRLALIYFVKALKALHIAGVVEAKSKSKSRRKNNFKSYLMDLARKIEKTYDLKEDRLLTLNDTNADLFGQALGSSTH